MSTFLKLIDFQDDEFMYIPYDNVALFKSMPNNSAFIELKDRCMYNGNGVHVRDSEEIVRVLYEECKQYHAKMILGMRETTNKGGDEKS